MYSIQTWNLNPERLDFQLYRIRAQIVRDGLEGLEHVDALLRLRGLDPEAAHIPRKSNPTFKRGEFRRIVLGALRSGPKTPIELWRATGKPQKRLFNQNMKRLEAQGIVKMGKRGWRLVR